MTYTTAMIKINGVWESVLVVASEEPTTFGNTIVHEDGGVTTTYHTKGLYKSVEENGTYYYWFIIQSKETTIVDTELLNQYEEALNIMGIETEVADDEAV